MISTLRLIRDIEIMQAHRWGRLRYWHNSDSLNMKSWHMFMRKEIQLLRSQKQRLIKLKQSVLQ